MPTYEYSCARCGVVEAFQRMTDSPLIRCPECGSRRIRRLLSGGAGVIFKGEGFWETDYNRSKDYKDKAAKESAPAPCGASECCPAKESGKACPAKAS